MKITKIMMAATLVTSVLFTSAAFAYTADRPEEDCKKPHFRDFSLPVYVAPENKEVPPESEFSIMMSPWVNPATIKLTGKGQKMNFTLESNDSFHRLTAKFPASMTGQFVRLNLSAKAVLGCDNQEGWLVKVAAAKPAVVAPPSAEPAPSEPLATPTSPAAEQPQATPPPEAKPE
jgi:hypothetical protein